MSRPDADRHDGADDHVSERILRREEFAADLNEQGYVDVLVLGRETGREALTDARLAIIQQLDRHAERVDSVSDLARELDRDKGAVSRDLQRLAELDVVTYEGAGNGETKRPMLKHDFVVVEPIVY